MVYDERETDYVKHIKNRTALGKLYDQCVSHGLNCSGEGWMEWTKLADEFVSILYDLEHGRKINLDILIKSYDTKLPNKIIVVQRLIKLMKMTNE